MAHFRGSIVGLMLEKLIYSMTKQKREVTLPCCNTALGYRLASVFYRFERHKFLKYFSREYHFLY